jgi:hypothetical protein
MRPTLTGCHSNSWLSGLAVSFTSRITAPVMVSSAANALRTQRSALSWVAAMPAGSKLIPLVPYVSHRKLIIAVPFELTGTGHPFNAAHVRYLLHRLSRCCSAL